MAIHITKSLSNFLPSIRPNSSCFYVQSQLRKLNTNEGYTRHMLKSNPQLLINEKIVSSIVSQASFSKNRNSFKKFFTLGIGGIVTCLAVYVGTQIYLGDDLIFVPLVPNFNVFSQVQYKYPQDLKYIDKPVFDYVEHDIKNTNDKGLDYFKSLQDQDIKYKVLETLSNNRELRKLYHIPIHIHTHPEISYQIHIESKVPTISGLQFPREKISKVSWCIKPINFWDIVENSIIKAGLKLDRLGTSPAEVKTHEKSSGRIHEVPISDFESNIKLNGNKNYEIIISGNFLINNEWEDIVHYKAKIDFDHLKINRGVKITNLMIERKNPNMDQKNVKVM